MNNGLVPVVVSPNFLAEIFSSVFSNPETTITVDLPNQTITDNMTSHTEKFEINAYKKGNLVNGLDDIDYLLANEDKIVAFERNRK